jgi:hypothetical protein
MSTAKPDSVVKVRVLPARTLSLNQGEGIAARSALHQPGDELELDRDEARQLIDDGFVEAVSS